MLPVALIFALTVATPEVQEDFDKDGVADVDDDCPTDPGVKEGKGCPAGMKAPPPTPAKPVEIEVKEDRLDVKETVEFRSGSASVDPASFGLLQSVAASILKLPAAKKLVIAGHTDNRGNKRKNEQLSEARAKAVIAHLVRAGVAADRLSAVGHGPNRPIADNKSEDGRKKNRRVEFLIVDGP
jgi:OmpA-OmpF porin, OOP family